jgi:ethanolaminephosphotransferase
MALVADEFHEVARKSSAAHDDDDDVPCTNPHDHHLMHVWFLEPPAKKGVLTRDGATRIATHEYRAGTYTWLDSKLNPVWTALTECLPMTMAPNLVTFLGALHSLLAFFVTWKYTENYDEQVPDWVLFLNAWCLVVYYTLDCMDGKQARRTNSSSPLGQLFDHGVDCFGLLAHLSSVSAWLCAGSTRWYYAIQAALQVSFFVAQWEEYYTEVLPHATGEIGVTEVTYAMALASLVNIFLDRQTFYTQKFADVVPFLAPSARIKDVILEPLFKSRELEVKHVFCLGWVFMMSLLMMLSILRVFGHVKTPKLQFSALMKLISPCAASLAPFLLPDAVIQRETRFVSLAVGLCLILMTIKIIVFSMAKQAYAAVQMDVLVVLIAAISTSQDSRWTPSGVHLVWQIATLYYLLRLYQWISAAISQICKRLGIRLFVIKPMKVD